MQKTAALRVTNPQKAEQLPATYALKAWSVKKTDKGWFVGPTASFDDKQKWKGPYRTLRHACMAIARKLEAEATERHARRCR